MTSISANLKYFRKHKQLTQLELARQLFVTPQAVSKWERGESFPDISLIPQIANLFQISISDLWQEFPSEVVENQYSDLNDLFHQLMETETLEELTNYFDTFVLLNEKQKETLMFKILNIANSDFVIEDYYYYLSSQLKESVILNLLHKKRYLALETLVPMMSSSIRHQVLEKCLSHRQYDFLDELFPFLTFSQKEIIIEKVRRGQLRVAELDNYLTFFTEKQRAILKQFEEE